jgi:uncharacterized membrane protein YbhN (UPF0104 family)
VSRTRLIAGLSFLLLILITAALIRRYNLTARDLLAFGSPLVHIAALGTATIELLARAARTRLLAHGLQAKLGVRDAVAVQLMADGASAITPARIGADPAKLMWLRRAHIEVARGGVILIGEATSEAVALTILVLVAAWLLRPHGAVALGALAYVLSTGSAVVVALVLSGRHRKRVLRALPLSPARRIQLLQILRHFAAHARQLFRLPGRYQMLILLAAATHICARVLILPILCFESVTPAALPVLGAWAFTLLYAGALVPLPSAGGVIELGFAAAFGRLIPTDALIPALLWWRIYTFYLGALGGAVVLWRSRRT